MAVSGVMLDQDYMLQNNTAMVWVGSDGKIGFQVGASVGGSRNAGMVCWPI